MASLARLTVWMVRLAVRLAGRVECAVWRARARKWQNIYFALTISDLANLILHSFAFCCTLLHSFALFVHRFVGFRTFASEIRGSLPPAPPEGGVTRSRGASHSSRRRAKRGKRGSLSPASPEGEEPADIARPASLPTRRRDEARERGSLPPAPPEGGEPADIARPASLPTRRRDEARKIVK